MSRLVLGSRENEHLLNRLTIFNELPSAIGLHMTHHNGSLRQFGFSILSLESLSK